MRKITFHPYTEQDGIRSLRDSDLLDIFNLMSSKNLLHKTFYDGSVTSDNEFISCFKHRENVMWVVLCDGVVAGIFWLNTFEHRTAQIHQCLFIDVLKRDIFRTGKLILELVMNMKDNNGEHMFDGLIGLTPASYHASVKYLQRAGMNIKATLPNAFRMFHECNRAEDAILSYVTKEEVLQSG